MGPSMKYLAYIALYFAVCYVCLGVFALTDEDE
jgi:hypothetical protein